MKLSRADVAKLSGLSKSAITQAVNKGLLVLQDNKIDTQAFINKEYFNKHPLDGFPAQQKPPPKKQATPPLPKKQTPQIERTPLKKRPPPKPPNKQATPTPPVVKRTAITPPVKKAPTIPVAKRTTLPIPQGVTKQELELLKIKTDIDDKAAAAKQKRLAYSRQAGKLIDREMAEYLFFSFMERLAADLLRLPSKLSQRITSLTEAGKPKEIQNLFADELTTSIREVKTAQKKEIDGYDSNSK